MQKARRPNEVRLDWVGDVSPSNQALRSELSGTRDPGAGSSNRSLWLRMKLLPNRNLLALAKLLHMTQLHTRARSMISITRVLCSAWKQDLFKELY